MITEQTTKTKYCPRCNQHKPVSDFSIDNSKRDGLQSFCKNCRNTDARSRNKNKNNKSNNSNSNNSKKSPVNPINPINQVLEFKSSSVTKHNFHELSQHYVKKYLNSDITDTPVESPPNPIGMSIDDLILEKKIELTILNHLKETGNKQ